MKVVRLTIELQEKIDGVYQNEIQDILGKIVLQRTGLRSKESIGV